MWLKINGWMEVALIIIMMLIKSLLSLGYDLGLETVITVMSNYSWNRG